MYATDILFAALEEEFTMLNDVLDELEFSDNNLKQFKLFVDPNTAIEFFNFPKKTTYKNIPICLVSDFPSRCCMVCRSTEYEQDK